MIRGLGPWAASAIVVGTMVGTGIFLKPSEMAAAGGSVSLVYAAWIAGGLLSLFGALSFAELGAAMPEAGGQYAYLRRGLGPIWGFLFGWMHSTVGESSSAASIAAGLARFSSFLIPALAVPSFHLAFQISIRRRALRFCVHLVAAHGRWRDHFFSPSSIILACVSADACRSRSRFSKLARCSPLWRRVSCSATEACRTSIHSGRCKQAAAHCTAFLAAIAAALWAYDGWEDLNRVGSEIQNPERNFPRRSPAARFSWRAIYLLFNAVCFYALPFSAVASSSHVASDVVESFAGPGRSILDHAGNDCRRARHAELIDYERRAGALCHGSRRFVLSRHRHRASALSHARRRA